LYTNFGVLPSFTSQLPKATEGIVVVIGAGFVGLAAARLIFLFGYKVVVLEGRYHPGREVYIEKIGNEGKFAVADLGGRVITGIHANL
jgi:monoamine oxidase